MKGAGLPRIEHTAEQGQRVHWLANLGGLVAIAGLEDVPPDLLVGALLSVASQLRRDDAKRDARLRRLGQEALEDRAAGKRAFAAYQRAQSLHLVYMTTAQCRRLLERLGEHEPDDERLVRSMMECVRALG